MKKSIKISMGILVTSAVVALPAVTVISCGFNDEIVFETGMSAKQVKRAREEMARHIDNDTKTIIRAFTIKINGVKFNLKKGPLNSDENKKIYEAMNAKIKKDKVLPQL